MPKCMQHLRAWGGPGEGGRGGTKGTNCNRYIVQARAARRANNLIILNNTAEGSSIYTTMHDHSPTLRGSPSRCGSPLPGSDAVMDITDRDHDVSIMP